MDEPLDRLPTAAPSVSIYTIDEPFDVSLALAMGNPNPTNTSPNIPVRAPFSASYTMDEPYTQPPQRSFVPQFLDDDGLDAAIRSMAPLPSV